MVEKMILDGVAVGSRVAVAMSGGVDSSVTSALMVEAGYEVVGITLQLYDQGAVLSKKGACCAGQDIYDARTVADRLGFPHYVLDYESVFQVTVVEDFVNNYLEGHTPIPCVRCNQQVKFKDLLHTAKDLGAQALITGHYVRRQEGPNGVELHQAVDPKKDQSYFLFATPKKQLEYLHFPLGTMTKQTTREHARRFGLSTAEKPDSQDICFVPTGGYAKVIEKLRPGSLEPGEIVHMDGRVLGKHDGIIHFTVGQRRGLKIALSEPLFVVKLDPLSHRVIVGPREALAITTVWVKEVNWLEEPEVFKRGKTTQVKLRSAHLPIPATLYAYDEKTARVELQTAEYGIANGQACVFFDRSRVLGGGWICPAPLN